MTSIRFKRLDLGTITDSFAWEWYTAPTASGKACWISPFRDSSLGHVIACFTIPVYKEGRKFAVMAVDIDTESFGAKCDEISPYPGARVTMLDRLFRYISHPDKSCLMRSVREVARERHFTFDDKTNCPHCGKRIEEGYWVWRGIRFNGPTRRYWKLFWGRPLKCPHCGREAIASDGNQSV